MGKIIFGILGLLLVLVGTILLYDARLIVKNTSKENEDENELTTGLKVIGYTFFSIGGIIVSLVV